MRPALTKQPAPITSKMTDSESPSGSFSGVTKPTSHVLAIAAKPITSRILTALPPGALRSVVAAGVGSFFNLDQRTAAATKQTIPIAAKRYGAKSGGG